MQKENSKYPSFSMLEIYLYMNSIQKVIESQNKFIGTFHFLFRINNSNDSLFRKITPYVFSGFSIIFI